MPALLEVIGSESRWKILELLTRRSYEMREIASQLGMTVQGAMKHLKLLEEYGLIQSRSQDRKLIYSTKGGVWLQKEENEQFSLIFFFSSKKVDQQILSSPPISFHVHRLLKRTGSYLIRKGSSEGARRRPARRVQPEES
jgi:predicted transcriptional regulator